MQKEWVQAAVSDFEQRDEVERDALRSKESVAALMRAKMILGDEPWQFPRTTSSLIDEVRIYDRALTPEHIAATASSSESKTGTTFGNPTSDSTLRTCPTGRERTSSLRSTCR